MDRTAIEVLVDKLSYFIRTNQQLISEDFHIKLDVDDSNSRTVYSKEAFFARRDAEHGFIKSLQLNLGYLLSFDRGDAGKRSVEKQLIVITFLAGRIGQIDVSIRSTEFTWPDAIFSVIDEEVKRLSQVVQAESPSRLGIVAAPARWLHLHKDLMDSMLIVPPFITFAAVFLFFWSSLGGLDRFVIFDFEQQSFDRLTLTEVLEQFGAEGAPTVIAASKVIQETGLFPIPAAARQPIVQRLLEIPPAFYLPFLFTACIVFLIYRESRVLQGNKVARIHISSSPPPPRQSVSPLSSLIASFSLATVTGLVTLLIERLIIG